MATQDMTSPVSSTGVSTHHQNFEPEQCILVTTVRGPIDCGVVNSVSQVYFRCLAELNETTVASIIVFQGNMSVTPDALQLIVDLLRSNREQPSSNVVIAYVAGREVEGREVACRLFEEVYRRNNIPWRCFDALDEAKRWATELITAAM